MERGKLIETSRALAARLQATDFDSLPISPYNKRYIRAIRPALPYYMEIYADCLYRGITSTQAAPREVTLIDYGGGSGFLSLLAREAGIGQVIYTDLNPLSAETARVIKQRLKTGPHFILQGDSACLANWCKARQLTPQLLIATDLIEHVYNLERFFSDLYGINPDMELIFTTASTPYNPAVKRRLRRFMQDCERGTAVMPNYYTRRKNFIQKEYPRLTGEQTETWSQCTRGLMYEDIKKTIDLNLLPAPEDSYNTCDPETGNWAERILPIRYYADLLALHNYKLTVQKGFYNAARSAIPASFIFRLLNIFIRRSGRLGLFLAPYIILHGRK
jgi:hypothetical protein